MSDGDGVALGGHDTVVFTSQIAVLNVNDAPTASGLAGDAAAFVEGGGPVRLDVGGDAVLLDPDRAPRAHERIEDRARVARAEHERDHEQEAEEQPAHAAVMRARRGLGKSRGEIW